MDRLLRSTMLCGALALIAGCATTSEDSESAPRLNSGSSTALNMAENIQFDPLPLATVDAAEDLTPPEPRPTADLIAEAREAFTAANAAIEAGDEDIAYQNYTIMMERLLEADLEPETFYTLREEFSGILSRSFEIARNYDRPGVDASPHQYLTDFGIDHTQLHARVQAEIDAIQRVYPKSFQAGLDRSYLYLPYIRAEFAKAGLPEDLVWLAMVESQFTPKINSHAGAGGMWQFMRSTGRRYGLSNDWYLDERYDWKKSTQAAVQYLSELYAMFDGNWPLAVTAYNMGEAGLEGAIASVGGERDLWRLIETPPASRRIRLESKRFYAKFLASAIVANNPEQYGFERRPRDEERTEYVTVDGSYALSDVEDRVGAPRGSLARLNPQYLRGYTPPARVTQLAAPESIREKVASVIEEMPELRLGTHTVRSGETLSGIAANYQVSAAELQRTNNIRSPKSLQIGQKLIIPGFEGTQNTHVAAEPGATTYTVRRGDSLSTIASAHRVSVNELQRWNNMGASTRITAGDRIIVAATAAPGANATAAVATDSTEFIYHTVKKGEVAGMIAEQYGVSLRNLLAWNGLSSRSTLQIGQKLKIAAPAKAPEQIVAAASDDAGPATTPIAPRKHVVAPGESAWVIAQKHGVATTDLLKWNRLDSNSVLREGDELLLDNPDQG